ncbi:MAG: glycosyl transferase family 28 [Chitinophagaceae bacterium]|nr:glycosyl transferase family 28 [Chitinophagaceae bacterium]
MNLSAEFNIANVLVAPLDWGLGHATRCIPLIRALLDSGRRVIIATSGPQRQLLEAEFPQCRYLDLPGYQVRYASSRGWLPFKIISQLPRLMRVIRKEHQWLERIIQEERIDLVISDNRYGLYTKQVPAVFITHQLTIQTPYAWLTRWVQRINYRYINRFNACWIPDAAAENGLGGALSHPQRKPVIPVHYMGWLCRFEKSSQPARYDLVFLLSGPEPQRTLLEEAVVAAIASVPGKFALVRGLPGLTSTLKLPEKVDVFTHLPTAELSALLQSTQLVVCRSGYTSLMELLYLQVPLLLVPTPGQTEQEYLAEYLSKAGYARRVGQEQLNAAAIADAIPARAVMPVERFSRERLEQLLRALS